MVMGYCETKSLEFRENLGVSCDRPPDENITFLVVWLKKIEVHRII